MISFAPLVVFVTAAANVGAIPVPTPGNSNSKPKSTSKFASSSYRPSTTTSSCYNCHGPMTGTQRIILGSIIGGIFLCLILWILWKTWQERREKRKTLKGKDTVAPPVVMLGTGYGFSRVDKDDHDDDLPIVVKPPKTMKTSKYWFNVKWRRGTVDETPAQQPPQRDHSPTKSEEANLKKGETSSPLSIAQSLPPPAYDGPPSPSIPYSKMKVDPFEDGASGRAWKE